MQKSLVTLDCLRKSSPNKVLTRVYRQLYRLDFYEKYGPEIVTALQEEKYHQLKPEQLNELKTAIEKILTAVFDAEFAKNSILRILKDYTWPATQLSLGLPDQLINRIDDGRFWRLYNFFSPGQAFFKAEKILIWERDCFCFGSENGDKREIDLGGFIWHLGEIKLDKSFKAKLLKPYISKSRPSHRGDLLNLPDKAIINYYQAEEYRFSQILSFLTKPAQEADLIYLLRQSLLKTLACKLKTSVKNVRRRYQLFDAD